MWTNLPFAAFVSSHRPDCSAKHICIVWIVDRCICDEQFVVDGLNAPNVLTIIIEQQRNRWSRLWLCEDDPQSFPAVNSELMNLLHCSSIEWVEWIRVNEMNNWSRFSCDNEIKIGKFRTNSNRLRVVYESERSRMIPWSRGGRHALCDVTVHRK